MITTTRMFGCQVTELKDVQEAVATYISRAAEKLRRQQSAAKIVTIYVVPKEEGEHVKYRHGPTESTTFILPAATSDTALLIKPALSLVEKLFKLRLRRHFLWTKHPAAIILSLRRTLVLLVPLAALYHAELAQ